MFDIGFPELLLVSAVALLVVGPDRLPEAVRTLMLWIGRLRRSFTKIKTEIEQEIGADEIRRQINDEVLMGGFGDTKQQIENAIHEADSTITDIKQSTNNPLT